MTSTTEGSRVVGMSLMKSDEAVAALEYVQDHMPDVRTEDHGTYYRFETDHILQLDLAEVADYLGRDLAMYYGNIDVSGDVLTISPESAAGMLRAE
jgi:hypothetical protein